MLVATFPHQNASLENLVIYQRVAHEIIDGLLKRVCKATRAGGPDGSVSQKFNKHLPLRQALDLEKAVLTHSIEKIAALDAADLKLKPRKGSTYPVREGQGNV